MLYFKVSDPKSQMEKEYNYGMSDSNPKEVEIPITAAAERKPQTRKRLPQTVGRALTSLAILTSSLTGHPVKSSAQIEGDTYPYNPVATEQEPHKPNILTNDYFFRQEILHPEVSPTVESLRTSEIHIYKDPQISLKRIILEGVYFVPKDRTDQMLPEWQIKMKGSLERVANFYKKEFKGQSEIVVNIRQDPIMGKEEAKQYFETDSGWAKVSDEVSGGRIGKKFPWHDPEEIKENGYKIVAMFADGGFNYNGFFFYGDYHQAWLTRELLEATQLGWMSNGDGTPISDEDKKRLRGNQYDQIIAHEIGHALSLPHPADDPDVTYKIPGAGKIYRDVMVPGEQGLLPLDDVFIHPALKVRMGLHTGDWSEQKPQRVHGFGNPEINLDNTDFKFLYFVPKGQQQTQHWKEIIEQSSDSMVNFHRKQLQNQSGVQKQIFGQPVFGEKSLDEYKGGYPTAKMTDRMMSQIINETNRRVFQLNGDLFDKNFVSSGFQTHTTYIIITEGIPYTRGFMNEQSIVAPLTTMQNLSALIYKEYALNILIPYQTKWSLDYPDNDPKNIMNTEFDMLDTSSKKPLRLEELHFNDMTKEKLGLAVQKEEKPPPVSDSNPNQPSSEKPSPIN